MAENTENPTIDKPEVPEEPKQPETAKAPEAPAAPKPQTPAQPKPAASKPPINTITPKMDDNDPSRKVSLVELIMILMLVGLVLVFIFGMQQMKIDKEKEAIAQQKFESIIPIFDNIIKGMEEYRKNDPFGEYPIALDELGTFSNPDFKFDYVADTKIITATSTKEFGKEGVEVKYSLESSIYEVVDPTPKEKPTVKDDWLP